MNDSTPLRSLRWTTPANSQSPSESEPSSGHPSTAPPSRIVLRTSAPLSFELSGDASVLIPTPGVCWVPPHRDSTCEVATAEGVATWTDESTLELTSSRRVTLSHNLPSSIDLRPLLGQTLRVTLVDEIAPNAIASQTLCISGIGGRVWLVARFGEVHGVVHTIGTIEVRAALSQRPEGPLVVGTEKLQWLVSPGCHVRLGVAVAGLQEELVVEHVARPSTETAAYLIAESAIYVA